MLCSNVVCLVLCVGAVFWCCVLVLGFGVGFLCWVCVLLVSVVLVLCFSVVF